MTETERTIFLRTALASVDANVQSLMMQMPTIYAHPLIEEIKRTVHLLIDTFKADPVPASAVPQPAAWTGQTPPASFRCHIPAAHPEDDDTPKCEGCEQVATRADSDDVPLCEECYQELIASSAHRPELKALRKLIADWRWTAKIPIEAKRTPVSIALETAFDETLKRCANKLEAILAAMDRTS